MLWNLRGIEGAECWLRGRCLPSSSNRFRPLSPWPPTPPTSLPNNPYALLSSSFSPLCVSCKLSPSAIADCFGGIEASTSHDHRRRGWTPRRRVRSLRLLWLRMLGELLLSVQITPLHHRGSAESWPVDWSRRSGYTRW
jgi:hypothetical protein